MKTDDEFRALVDLNNNLTSHRDELMGRLAEAKKQIVELREALSNLIEYGPREVECNNREEGERNNTCTFNALGEVCGHCECKRKPFNDLLP